MKQVFYHEKPHYAAFHFSASDKLPYEAYPVQSHDLFVGVVPYE
jgi:hypothetical protein